MKYSVYLTYAKEFIVEADSEEEAIRKAHQGDVLEEYGLYATNDDEVMEKE